MVLASLVCWPALASDWPLFRGNPLQTGVATAELPKELKVRWTFKTGDAIESAPAIVDGVVYVGSMDEYLYAIDLKTGREKWKYKAGPIKAPPGVHRGLVYVGDVDGKFYCVEAATGRQRWTFETEGEITSGANFAGDKILFGSGDETLYCLSPEGKKLWGFKIEGGPVIGSPSIVGEHTFVAGCDSSLHVVNVNTGKESAAVDLGGQVGATAALDGDMLYVGTMTNQVVGVNWKKGEVLWKFEPERAQPFYASNAVTDKLVIAGSRDKRVYGLDRKDGKEVWSFATGSRIEGSPVVVKDRIYVGSMDRHLYVLDLARGTQLQKINLNEPIAGSPAVGGGCLVIGNTRGEVYCFE
jgi:outer membrane protein assembly factor BamB